MIFCRQGCKPSESLKNYVKLKKLDLPLRNYFKLIIIKTVVDPGFFPEEHQPQTGCTHLLLYENERIFTPERDIRPYGPFDQPLKNNNKLN